MKLLLFLGLIVGTTAALAPFYSAGKNGVKGRYIVVLQDDVDIDISVNRFMARVSRSNLLATIKRKITLINAFVTIFPEEGLDILRSLPGVAYVEEDEIIYADAVGSWGLDRIDQRNWNGGDGEMTLNGYGAGAHIYVIDSGINPDHRDFGGRAGVAEDFVGDGMNGIDCDGHGTHCAGTAAGNEYGVAREAQVHALRIFDCRGSGYTSDSIAALDWVAKYGEKPGVVSMSIGGSKSISENRAVAGCREAGFIVVASAGNDNSDACNQSPASAPEAITVGATGDEDRRSSYSNYGTCVNIFAPGSYITSLRYDNNYGTSVKSGTSMACPHVSGIAAVMAMEYNGIKKDGYVDYVYDNIIAMGTKDVIDDPGVGSPNVLAYCD